mmetsp:Transcript_17744/g.45735  ORF Transcript_17744/g.45735 Transcript_17744/m.45735 type:complete len:213 (-) Transcript_17744:803-1441(-)
MLAWSPSAHGIDGSLRDPTSELLAASKIAVCLKETKAVLATPGAVVRRAHLPNIHDEVAFPVCAERPCHLLSLQQCVAEVPALLLQRGRAVRSICARACPGPTGLCNDKPVKAQGVCLARMVRDERRREGRRRCLRPEGVGCCLQVELPSLFASSGNVASDKVLHQVMWALRGVLKRDHKLDVCREDAVRSDDVSWAIAVSPRVEDELAGRR